MFVCVLLVQMRERLSSIVTRTLTSDLPDVRTMFTSPGPSPGPTIPTPSPGPEPPLPAATNTSLLVHLPDSPCLPDWDPIHSNAEGQSPAPFAAYRFRSVSFRHGEEEGESRGGAAQAVLPASMPERLNIQGEAQVNWFAVSPLEAHQVSNTCNTPT